MEHNKSFLFGHSVEFYRSLALTLFLVVAMVGVWKIADSYANRVDPVSFRSFAVSGEGKSVAVPDIAEFSFSVITEGGKDIAALQSENTNKMNSSIAFLKQNGIDEKDIKTQNYNLSPRYEYRSCTTGICPPPQIVGYSINQSVVVKVRDFSKIGELLSGIVKNGANSVSDLRFTLDDPTSVESEARAEAIEKARVKAEAVAKAGGFSLGRLLSIEETPGYYPLYSSVGFGRGGDAMMEKSAPAIEPGSQETSVTVTLRYEIRN